MSTNIPYYIKIPTSIDYISLLHWNVCEITNKVYACFTIVHLNIFDNNVSRDGFLL